MDAGAVNEVGIEGKENPPGKNTLRASCARKVVRLWGVYTPKTLPVAFQYR